MRKWTLLIYMAADNDLQRFADKDVHEMEAIGSSDDVAVVVQIDRRGSGGDGTALRGHIERNPLWERYNVTRVSRLEDIGEVNTGEPATLAEFIRWGLATYPAERTALIIWNHGSGWRDEFIYEEVSKVAPGLEPAMRSADFAVKYRQRTRRTLFRSTLRRRIEHFVYDSLVPSLPGPVDTALLGSGTVATNEPTLAHDDLVEIVNRAIGLDESAAGDALDSVELRDALQDGYGARRIEILGFDACLMASVEVAYELRDIADYIVASEEIEPGVGWSYGGVLAAFAGPSAADVDALSVALVDAYIEGLSRYKIRLITQSAVRTSVVLPLMRAIDAVGGAALARLDSQYGRLAAAEKRATRFYDADFLDFGDYLARLGEHLPDFQVADAIRDYASFVRASRFAFPSTSSPQRPTGVSVYYPTRPVYDEVYDELAASEALPRWIEFIKRYHFLV